VRAKIQKIMASESVKVINYLENILPEKIIAKNDEFRNCQVIDCKAVANNQSDGFLSLIFKVTLTLQDKTSKR
jgi:hypothetical protein